jgi:hypothetical protein
MKPVIHAFRKQRSLLPPPKRWLMCSLSFSGSAPVVLPCTPSLPEFPGGYSHVLGMTSHVSSALLHPT